MLSRRLQMCPAKGARWIRHLTRRGELADQTSSCSGADEQALFAKSLLVRMGRKGPRRTSDSGWSCSAELLALISWNRVRKAPLALFRRPFIEQRTSARLKC
jgi:hypothetical protein